MPKKASKSGALEIPKYQKVSLRLDYLKNNLFLPGCSSRPPESLKLGNNMPKPFPTRVQYCTYILDSRSVTKNP